MAYKGPEYHRAWREANPEKVLAARRRYEAKNPRCRQEWLAADPARAERHKETTRLWSQNNRDRRNASQAKAARKRYEFLNAYKLEQGCVDCGYKEHACALDFDHRDPAEKEFTIGLNPRTTMARIIAEMAKCDVRCKNCHAVRTKELGHLRRKAAG
jgi:hypothetical protein